MAEALPFTQVNISGSGGNVNRNLNNARSAGRDTKDPGGFERVFSEYQSRGGDNRPRRGTASPTPVSREQAVPQGKPVVLPPQSSSRSGPDAGADEPVAFIPESRLEDQNEAPSGPATELEWSEAGRSNDDLDLSLPDEELTEIVNQYSGLTGKENAEKLAGLTAKLKAALKAGAPDEDISSLRGEIAGLLEALSDGPAPDMTEELNQRLLDFIAADNAESGVPVSDFSFSSSAVPDENKNENVNENAQDVALNEPEDDNGDEESGGDNAPVKAAGALDMNALSAAMGASALDAQNGPQTEAPAQTEAQEAGSGSVRQEGQQGGSRGLQGLRASQSQALQGQNIQNAQDAQNLSQNLSMTDINNSEDDKAESETESPDNETRSRGLNDLNRSQRTEGQSVPAGQHDGSSTPGRPRGDTHGRTGDAGTEDERSRALERTERTQNVRGDFQSFFEGVLSSRRTLSQNGTAPLDLRPDANYNYAQSETLRDGLVNVVRFVRADGVQRANVIVDPPALGRISVELTSNASGVEASIKVVNEQVRQLVQDQLTQLRMTLEQQGVQVTQFAVDVQQDDGRRQQGQEQQGRRQGRRVGAVEDVAEETAEEFRVDLEQGLLYWVA